MEKQGLTLWRQTLPPENKTGPERRRPRAMSTWKGTRVVTETGATHGWFGGWLRKLGFHPPHLHYNPCNSAEAVMKKIEPVLEW